MARNEAKPFDRSSWPNAPIELMVESDVYGHLRRGRSGDRSRENRRASGRSLSRSACIAASAVKREHRVEFLGRE